MKNTNLLKTCAAAATALLLSLVVAKADAVNGVVKNVTGESYLTEADGSKVKVTPGMSIPPGSSLFTGAGSTVALQLVPGATTVVTPGAEVGFLTLNYAKSTDNATDRKVGLNLKKGSVFCSLFKAKGKSDYTVKTPTGVAAARGTDWVVTVGADGTSTYQVLGGTVNLTLPDGSTISIGAGQQYNTGGGGVTSMTPQEITKLKKVITDAGLSLSHAGNGTLGDGSTYYNDGNQGGTLNPSNLSGNAVQSPSQ